MQKSQIPSELFKDIDADIAFLCAKIIEKGTGSLEAAMYQEILNKLVLISHMAPSRSVKMTTSTIPPPPSPVKVDSIKRSEVWLEDAASWS